MKLKELATILDIPYSKEDFEVSSFATLEEADESNIVFFDDRKLIEKLKNTKAKAILTTDEFKNFAPKSSIVLICENPHLSFAIASKYFAKEYFNFDYNPSIDKDAQIGANVQIGSNSKIEKNVIIYPNVTIGQNVHVGENSIIYPNVVIYGYSKIGANCILQAGAIIGSDGFGYAHNRLGEHIKIYHNGNVVLGDNVEIGANTTIDRAVFGSTIIRNGAKLDNLIQIGHNCELGEHCIMVSQSGLSGSTKLGRNVIMGGQSATAGHLSIGDFAVIAARSGVTKTLEGGKTYGGFPLMLQRDWLRKQAKITKITKN